MPCPCPFDSCADALLRHLYRWLCSPASRLHSRELQHAVQALQQKLLLQLVGPAARSL